MHARRRRAHPLGVRLAGALVVVLAANGVARAGDLWDAHVAPILAERCVRCHGDEKRKSGLDLRTAASARAGGERGPAVVEDDPAASLLLRVLAPGNDPHMPPGDQLAAAEIALIEAWVRDPSGAVPEVLDVGAVDHVGESAAARTFDAVPAPAAIELPPPGLAPELVIDFLVATRWQELGVTPAAPCDDRAFVRRVHLDLIGRIPSPRETEAFLARTDSAKRQALVDELLASPEHARHLREVFDVVLMSRRLSSRRRERELEARRESGWHRYLEDAFRENVPWDRIVADVLLARPEDGQARGAVWFLYERKNDHKEIAEAVAPAIFGVEVACAQCHDHPLAPEIEQGDYWGLVSFFSRSQNVDTPRGPAVSESAVGGFVRFADLAGESHDAVLATFTGERVPEERPAEGTEVEDRPENYLVPPASEGEPARAAVPRVSRRESLVRAVVEQSPLVARAFVNRTWALLCGRGLVHPVDRMDSKHPPSHPRLLDWLARDFRASGHDVRRLVRAICASRVYQLDSRPVGDGPRPPDDSFAVALEKPLTAEMLHRSLLVAAGGVSEPLDAGSGETRSRFEELFPDVLSEEFSPRLAQALFVSNGSPLASLLEPRDGNLVARAIALDDDSAAIALLFEQALGRAPDESELRETLGHVAARRDRRDAALAQVLWALLASAEFRLNH